MGDIVKYGSKIIKPATELFYIMLNKPVGYITTVKDERGRATVLDLLPSHITVYPVGRLDRNTSGLLLLTNDGELAYKLTHPKHQIQKTYIVQITGTVTKSNIEKLTNGVRIDGYLTKPAQVKIIKNNNAPATLQITITEGKNRQIRKMIKAIDHTVISLERVSVHNLQLGSLKQGSFRHLTQKEVVTLAST